MIKLVTIRGMAGGIGKTMIAQLIQAGLQIAGVPHRVVDGDAGNKGYAEACGDAAATCLDPLDDAFDAEALVAGAMAAGETLILDTGANMDALAQVARAQVIAIQRAAKALGVEQLTVLPISTNKAIGEYIFRQTLARARAIGDSVVVRNDAAGSSAYAFEPGEEPDYVADIGAIAAGFVALRHKHHCTLGDFIMSPAPGCRSTAGVFAARCVQLFSQVPFSSLIGPAGLAAINEYAKAAPAGLQMMVHRAAHATDDAVTINQELACEHGRIEAAARADPSHPYARAVQLRDRWQALR